MNRTQTAGRTPSSSTNRKPSVRRRLAGGESNLEQGQYAEAIHAARQVLASDPNHLGGLELLARAHWRSGECELALDDLRHLIRLNPYEPGYHFLRGGALQALGLYGEAVHAYARCLESDNASLKANAATAIRELETWQEGLIAEMLKSDRKFRAEYAIDPVEACKAHGFAFTAEDASVSAQLAATAELPIASWDRPS